MRYQRKVIEVEAMELTGEIVINGGGGGPGDFLVNLPGGTMKVIAREDFLAEYEPVIPISSAYKNAALVDAKPYPPVMIPMSSLIHPSQVAPKAPPTEAEFKKILAEDLQTKTCICFSCGEDVLTSSVNEHKVCKSCQVNPPPPKQEPEAPEKVEPVREKITLPGVVYCCDECGTPTYGEEMKNGLCQMCKPKERAA